MLFYQHLQIYHLRFEKINDLSQLVHEKVYLKTCTTHNYQKAFTALLAASGERCALVIIKVG